ncbi:hypothetical protein LTR04_004994, partial [Oleoguttula sp. CCFEE 6159]
ELSEAKGGLQVTRHKMTADDIPEHLVFAENRFAYPTIGERVHRSYQKCDKPVNFMVAGSSKKPRAHTDAIPSVLVIRGASGMTAYGFMHGDDPNKDSKTPCRTSFHAESQYPCVKIRVRMDGAAYDSVCSIFASNLDNSFAITVGHAVAKADLPND